jgi:hypothetical protein
VICKAKRGYVSWKPKLSLPIINAFADPSLETAEAWNRYHYKIEMEERPYISVGVDLGMTCEF